MKKEISFIALMSICGLVTGLAITAILMAIASPDHLTNQILTIAEKQDLVTMIGMAERITGNTTLFIFLPTLTVSLITVLFCLLILNSQITITNLRSRTAKLKLSAVLVTLAGVYALAAVIEYALGITINRPFLTSISEKDISGIPIILAYFETAVLGGLTWLIVGETGWAGDLSSFKMGSADKKARPIECLVLGALAGILTTSLFFSLNWTFNRFFLLISEVFDQSGETSFLGFKYLGLMMVTMLTVCGCIVAALTLSLAPVNRDWSYRCRRLILPAALAFVCLLSVLGINQHAAVKYDLDKKDLAQAAGLSSSAERSKTILLFKSADNSSDVLLQEWPMAVEGYSMMGKNIVTLSEENLTRIIKYIDNHPDGSVYKYTAFDVLYKGYHALWDIERGKEYQFEASLHLLLPRIMMISSMKSLPVTDRNIGYLRAFSDEKTWYVGKKIARKIAAGFIHFNMFDEAGQWIKKAEELKPDQSESSDRIVIPAVPMLTAGKVTGGIKVNGDIPANTKIALFSADLMGDKISIWNQPISMVDAHALDQEGRFLFNNLGQGKYVLALMTESEIVPFNISADRIKVKNLPGPIELDIENSVADLGDIEINVEL